MKNIKLNVPMFIYVSYIAKMAIFGASMADAIVLFPISAIFGYKMYLSHIKQPDINKEVKDKLENMESILGGLQVGNVLKGKINDKYHW